MSKMFAKRFGSPRMDGKGQVSIEGMMGAPATDIALSPTAGSRSPRNDPQKLKNRMSTAIRKSFNPLSPKSPSTTTVPTLSSSDFVTPPSRGSNKSNLANRKSMAISSRPEDAKRDRRRSSFSGAPPALDIPAFDPSNFRRPSLPSINLSFRKSSYVKNAALAPPGGSLHAPPIPTMVRSASGQSTRSHREKPHPVIPPSSFGPSTMEPLLEGLGIGLDAPQLKLSSKPMTPPLRGLRTPSPRFAESAFVPVPAITYIDSSPSARPHKALHRSPRNSPRNSPRHASSPRGSDTPPDSPSGRSRSSSMSNRNSRIARVPPPSSNGARPISAVTLEIKAPETRRGSKSGEAPPVPQKSPQRGSVYGPPSRDRSMVSLSPPTTHAQKRESYNSRSYSVDSLHPMINKRHSREGSGGFMVKSHSRQGSGSVMTKSHSRTGSGSRPNSRPVSRSSSAQSRPLSVMKPLPSMSEFVLRPTVSMSTQTPDWNEVKQRTSSVSSTWSRSSARRGSVHTKTLRTPEQSYEPFPANLASIAPPPEDLRRLSRHSGQSRNSPSSEYPPTPMISNFPATQPLFSHIGYKTSHKAPSIASSIYDNTEDDEPAFSHETPQEEDEFETEAEDEQDQRYDARHALPSFEIQDHHYDDLQPPLPSFTPAFHTPFDPAFKMIKKKYSRDGLDFNRPKSRSPRPRSTPPSSSPEPDKTPSMPSVRTLPSRQNTTQDSLAVPASLDFVPTNVAIARPKLTRRRSSQPNTSSPVDEEHLALSRAEKSRSFFLVQALNKPAKKAMTNEFTEDEDDSDDGSENGSLFL